MSVRLSNSTGPQENSWFPPEPSQEGEWHPHVRSGLALNAGTSLSSLLSLTPCSQSTSKFC